MWSSIFNIYNQREIIILSSRNDYFPNFSYLENTALTPKAKNQFCY